MWVLLPSMISFLRCLMGLFLFLSPFCLKKFILFSFLAGLSDFLDGFIARKKNITTKFGAIFDPIADRTFFLSACALLFKEKIISQSQMSMFFVRDLILLIHFIIWNLGKQVKAPPFQSLRMGKILTCFQFIIILQHAFGYNLLLLNIVHAIINIFFAKELFNF